MESHFRAKRRSRPRASCVTSPEGRKRAFANASEIDPFAIVVDCFRVADTANTSNATVWMLHRAHVNVERLLFAYP
jgi:hypothetical protein